MEFGLSQPQTMLRDAIAQYVAQEVPVSRVREIAHGPGFDSRLLASLGSQGVLGLLIPEEYGGSGLGLFEACIAAQELGRGVTPVAFDRLAVTTPLLLAAGGSIGQRKTWLPRIAAGEATVVPVLDGDVTVENGHLSGRALFVPHGADASAFLVADNEGGVHLAPAGAAGLTCHALDNIDDTRRLAELGFDGVAAEALAGDAAIDRALQAARIALAADTLGASQQALEIARDYALERQQFGRIVGSYQAVKHMCAEVAADCEPVQALVWYAAHAWDEDLDLTIWLAPLAKAHATEVATEAVAKTTQVFGGMGFTWECDMHLYFKRVGQNRQLLGSPSDLFREAAALRYPAA